jgi:hypothetical protein
VAVGGRVRVLRREEERVVKETGAGVEVLVESELVNTVNLPVWTTALARW